MYVDLHAESEISLEEAQSVFELSLEVGEGKSFPNLIRMRNLAIPSKEARDFIASEERATRALAEAYVIHSLPQKIVGNFYVRFNRPPVPTKLFTNERDAIAWLKDILNTSRNPT